MNSFWEWRQWRTDNGPVLWEFSWFPALLLARLKPADLVDSICWRSYPLGQREITAWPHTSVYRYGRGCGSLSLPCCLLPSSWDQRRPQVNDCALSVVPRWCQSCFPRFSFPAGMQGKSEHTASLVSSPLGWWHATQKAVWKNNTRWCWQEASPLGRHHQNLAGLRMPMWRRCRRTEAAWA